MAVMTDGNGACHNANQHRPAVKLGQAKRFHVAKPCPSYACFILDIARANRENPRVNHAKYSINIPPHRLLHVGREHKRLLSVRGF
jgi:hypothetical protein